MMKSGFLGNYAYGESTTDSMFRSDVALEGPTRQEFQSRINSLEGTLASMSYRSFRFSVQTQQSSLLLAAVRRDSTASMGSDESNHAPPEPPSKDQRMSTITTAPGNHASGTTAERDMLHMPSSVKAVSRLLRGHGHTSFVPDVQVGSVSEDLVVDDSLKNLSLSKSRMARRSATRLRRLYKSESTSLPRKTVDARNAELLRVNEQRIRENTNYRRLREDTSVFVGTQKMTRIVYQPRSNKNKQKHVEMWNDFGVLLARGEIFGEDEAKKCQDCIATCSWEDYQCIVSCDGHGNSGEEVAWQVCNYLSGKLMENIIQFYDKMKSHKRPVTPTEMFDKSVTEEMIKSSFKECDDTIIWSKEMRNWSWVKIVGGEFDGLMGQVTSPNVSMGEPVLPTATKLEEIEEEAVPISVFLNGERKWKTKTRFGFSRSPDIDRQTELPVVQKLIPRKYIFCERDFHGGSTCLVFIRNLRTNQFKYAATGDTRLIIMPSTERTTEDLRQDHMFIPTKPAPSKMSKEFLRAILPRGSTRARPQDAFLSIEHSILDPRELARLQKDYPGKFIVGGSVTKEGTAGYMYSNSMFPYTGGITPTRGFGDRLYFGTGYTSEPEVSATHVLDKRCFVMGGSDGVFDESVWGKNMKNLVQYLEKLMKEPYTAKSIIEAVQEETTRRCEQWDHYRVDDISLFGLIVD